jgi:predicted SnoaL-like aldol condensation-catalyzing enzyme
MTPIRMEKIESASRIVMAYIEAFNRHDIPGIVQFVSDDCRFEDSSPAPDGTVYKGKAPISQYYQAFFDRFPQAHLKAEELLGYGIRCMLRWQLDWIDPSDNPAHVRGIDLFRVQQDLICERYSYIKG